MLIIFFEKYTPLPRGVWGYIFRATGFEEFHTDLGSSNTEKSLKNGSNAFFDVYSEIHEHTDGNWLFRVMSRGLSGEPWYYDTLRGAIFQHIEF